VCVEEGAYYVDLVPEVGLTMVIIPDTNNEAELAAKLESGECIGVMGDSTQEINVGQPQTGLPALDATPYGVAAATPELAAKLSVALVTMMNEGADSEILSLEKIFVLPAGLPPNPHLVETVDGISNFSLNETVVPAVSTKAATGTAPTMTKPAAGPTSRTLRVAVRFIDSFWPMVRNISATEFEGTRQFQAFIFILPSICRVLSNLCPYFHARL
jgi:hypothetical protein